MEQSKQEVPVALSGQRPQFLVNIASFLRDNAILKQRTGLLNNTTDADFFRYKRAIRALLSDEYKQKQANPKNELIPISSEGEAQKVFILLIQGQFLAPVEKLHYHEIKKANRAWKPNKTKPTLKSTNKANLSADSYFVWTYNKPNPFILLYSLLLIAGVFAVILFPLWPVFMKTGVWYISIGLLGLLGLFFLIAIIRLIIYIGTLLLLPRAFWLYPNLFEDCGVIESFKPLYAWEEPKSGSKKKKASLKSSQASNSTSEDATASGVHTSSSAPVKRKVILEEVDE